MKTSTQTQRFVILTLTAATSAALFSCGGRAYRETNAQIAPGSGTLAGDTNRTPSNTATDTSTTTITDGHKVAPITTTFTLTGQGSQTLPAIPTDNVLKIKVTAGNSPTINVPGSNFTANYGCVQFTVSALGWDIQTKTLSVNGGSFACKGAPTSDTIDFSGRLTSGVHEIEVKISNAVYDFYCTSCYQFYPYLYSAQIYGCQMYCPLHPVYTTHRTRGTLEIDTNGSGN